MITQHTLKLLNKPCCTLIRYRLKLLIFLLNEYMNFIYVKLKTLKWKRNIFEFFLLN